jgi:CheY-like chemotaxis protein
VWPSTCEDGPSETVLKNLPLCFTNRFQARSYRGSGLQKFYRGSERSCCVTEKRVPKVAPTVILCIDDDPKALMARSLLLSIAGYEVRTAASAEAGWNLFRNSRVDVVLTEQYLQGMKGAQIARPMKSLKPEILFVLLNGAFDPPTETDDVDLILMKCLGPSVFLRSIEKLIARRKLSIVPPMCKEIGSTPGAP